MVYLGGRGVCGYILPLYPKALRANWYLVGNYKILYENN